MKRDAPNLLLPKLARVVRDRDLADAETAPVGERGQEAMELAVHLDRLDDLAAVELEPAVEIMQRDAARTHAVTALNRRDGKVFVHGS